MPNSPRRTAALLVEVFSTGIPGRVNVQMSNCGPEELTQVESLNLLKSALVIMEAEIERQADRLSG